MPLTSRYRPLVYIACLTLVVLSVFGPVLQNEFVDWDDRNEIFANAHLNPVTFDGLKWNWTHTQLSLYMPVTFMVWGAVAAVAPHDMHGVLRPFEFHLLNLSLHLFCSILVFSLLRQLWRCDGAALIGSLLFAVHPLQAEPVAWASGMYTLLSTAFSLIALIAYVAHVSGLARAPIGEKVHFLSRNYLFFIATLFYALALLSKAASVSLPLAAVVIDLFIVRRQVTAVVRSVSIWVVLAIPIVLLAKSFQDLTNVPIPPPWGRPIVAVDAVGFYLAKIIVPRGLIPDYGRNPEWVMHHFRGITASVAIALITLLMACSLRKTSWIVAGVGVFIAGISPYLGLTTFDFQYVSTVADRYAYFGMVGVATLGCGAAMHSRRAMFALLIICAVWGELCHRQVQWWRDTDTLFAHTLAINPRSLVAHNVLGYEAAHSGRPAEAEKWYLGALRIWPADAVIWFNLGNLHLDKDPTRAVEEYGQAVKYSTQNAAFRKNLAAAFVRLGRLDESMSQYRVAIHLDPTDPDTHYSLAALLEGYGDLSGARREYLTVLRLSPSHAGAQKSIKRLARPTPGGR